MSSAAGEPAGEEERERKVPVLRSERSLVEQEFDSIREKFELEMGKMEEEMAKFRAQLIESAKSTGKSVPEVDMVSSSCRRTLRKTTTSRTVCSSTRAALEEGRPRGAEQEEEESEAAHKAHQPEGEGRPGSGWLNSSPLIKDDGLEGKILKLRFDVSLYEPEQILVKTIGDRLLVEAKREERNDNRSLFRQFDREFQLPANVDTERVSSSLSSEGILTVEAPLGACERK